MSSTRPSKQPAKPIRLPGQVDLAPVRPALPPMPQQARQLVAVQPANPTSAAGLAQPAFSINTSGSSLGKKVQPKSSAGRARYMRGRKSKLMPWAISGAAGLVLLVGGACAAWWAMSTPAAKSQLAAVKPSIERNQPAPVKK